MNFPFKNQIVIVFLSFGDMITYTAVGLFRVRVRVRDTNFYLLMLTTAPTATTALTATRITIAITATTAMTATTAQRPRRPQQPQRPQRQ